MLTMDHRLTSDQVAKLHKAIDSATRPGICRYRAERQPACVIGQLAVLEGISVDTLRKWDDDEYPGIGELITATPGLFSEYPINLLIRLQKRWDHIGLDVKPEMHQMVTDAS